MTSMLGGIVEAVLEQPAGDAATSPRTGADGDVSIGGLPFHLAITDQNPYQRATAQFKKDQLDAAPNPGDQSLTGWWTRGQFSFHKGSGVTYYEVEEGETVLNRYNDSTGVDPFTPGRVTLCPDWSSATSDGHATTSYVSSAGDKLVVLDGGTVYYGAVGGAGTTYLPSGATCRSVTTGNGDIYTANTNKTITRIGLAETVVQLGTTEDFESSTGSFAFNSAFGAFAVGSVASSTAKAFVNTHSLEATMPAIGATTGAWFGKSITGMEVGQAYSLVAKIWIPAGTTIIPDALFNASGTGVAGTDAWVTISHTFVANGQTFIGFKNTAPSAGVKVYVDKFAIYRGTVTDYPTGTPPIDVIYSSTNDIRGLFYAKDRLFMVDSTNTFYQLSPNPSGAFPVAIGSGDKVFSVGGDTTWTCVDTPGPVLLGNNNRIFAVTVDASGDIPTLSGPIQVADLPLGESVSAMAYHLGFLVVATTAGLRVAAVSDSGTVSYGPILIDFTSAPGITSIARHGSRVVVCGDYKLYDIDLSEQIGDGLEFGWAKMPSPFVGSEVNYGATLAPDLRVVAWSDSVTKVQSSTNLTASGDLTTGYHRYATLEPKRFSSVKVRAAGSGGSITISRVDADGTVTSLYTLDVASAKEIDVGLNMSAPAEAVALKFTLMPKVGDATVGPTLLGYQLRALPEPQRQRLIQLPLAIKDVERRQPARSTGRTGGAWDRLQALEDLETSGATTQFQDYRTGESATVYIEQMQFTNATPPTSGSSGFGGVALVTLRKL